MKQRRKPRVLAALATVALGGGAAIWAAQSPAGAEANHLFALPGQNALVHCYEGAIPWDGITPVDHEFFCNVYDYDGNFIEQSVHMTYNYENCDRIQPVWVTSGDGPSWVDISNGDVGDLDGTEIRQPDGHRGGCVRGVWQSDTQGVGTSYPDWSMDFHGSLHTSGRASQQDVCGVAGLPPNQCPGIGRSLRIYVW